MTRDPQGGVRGCFESHRLAWRKAKESGLQNVLILEDDVFFTPDWRTYLKDMSRFMNENDDWDCLFLGLTPFRTQKTPWSHVVRLTCGTTTHAYIVSERGLAKQLLPYDEVLKPLDDYLMCNQCTKTQRATPLHMCLTTGEPAPYSMYVVRPMIALQKYDGVSTAAGSGKWLGKRKQNVRLMRLYGETSTCMTTANFTMLWILLAVMVVVGMVTGIVVACKRK